jgi:hypothetical protein
MDNTTYSSRKYKILYYKDLIWYIVGLCRIKPNEIKAGYYNYDT